MALDLLQCSATGGGTSAAPSPDPSLREAPTQLVEANLPLVAFVAKRFQGRGLPLADLIQEGYFGLARAVETYDPAQGAFSTYAVPWIGQAINRALENTSRPIRLPRYVHRQLRALARVQDAYLSTQGRVPTGDELAGTLGLAVTQVHLLLAHQPGPISLDRPVSGHTDSTLADLLPDTSTPAPGAALDQQAHTRERTARVQAALCCLTAREQEAIVLRFGLHAEQDGLTCAQIGKQMGISRGRVHQLLVRALAKLAAHPDLLALVAPASSSQTTHHSQKGTHDHGV